MGSVREPAVAGAFYAGSAEGLRKQVEALFRHPLGPGQLPVVDPSGPRRIVGLVCPHAGYMYSGAVAAHAYAALAGDGKPDVVAIVGPNHYGVGPAVAVSTAREWRTPLGALAVDRGVADAVVAALPWPAEGEAAHAREHSVEVQLPFLQYLYGDTVVIVPVSVTLQDLEVAEALGQALAAALAGRNAVVIASTDLSHYQPQDIAVARDRQALEAMATRDPQKVLATAARAMNMCGPGPVATGLVAARALGATTLDMLKYATSGDAAGDLRQVVGYAALAYRK